MNLRRSGSWLALLMALVPARPVWADVRQLTLPANDLIYDRFRGKIYASVPSRADGSATPSGGAGNSIAVIDPETGTVGPFIPVGSEPNRMAISDDGHYLYVGLDGAGAVRRIDLTTLTAGLQFSLGNGIEAPYRAADLVVMPGHPETVAVSRASLSANGFHEGVVIYDDGVPRPKVTARRGGEIRLAFSDSPSRLYANDSMFSDFGFRRLQVDSDGVTLLDPAPVIGGLGSAMSYSSGRVYFDNGRVIDPEAQLLLGTYTAPPPGPNSPRPYNGDGYAVDSDVGRVFALADNDMSATLYAFDELTFLFLGSVDITGTGGAGPPLRWGQERSDAGGGLAFLAAHDQLFLVRTPLIPAEDLVLSFRPPSVQGGSVTTGRIDLRGAAPAGGAIVSLVSDQPGIAAVPGSVLVPEGSTVASFLVRTTAVSGETAVHLTAGYRGQPWAATLPVLPKLSFAVTLQTGRLVGSLTTNGVITLNAPAPAGGVTVALASDNAAIMVPPAVTVPAGGTTAQFPVTTSYVTGTYPVNGQITATYGEVSSAAGLTLLPADVASLSLQPNRVVGGDPVTGTVTLNAAAPPDGFVVQLSAGNGEWLSVPSTVTVFPGKTTATFPVTTFPISGAEVTAAVTGFGRNRSASGTVFLLPRVPSVLNVMFDTAPIIGGHVTTGTVNLLTPAPPGGTVVTLASSSPGTVKVPATVTVAAGSSSAAFLVSTAPVPAARTVTVSASTEAGTQTGSLSVLSAGITAFTVSPTAVTGGNLATGTVTLFDPAPGRPGEPGGGAVVRISSDNPPAAAVPQYVVVPGGAQSASFTFRTAAVRATTLVVISATYAGETTSVTLRVDPRPAVQSQASP